MHLLSGALLEPQIEGTVPEFVEWQGGRTKVGNR